LSLTFAKKRIKIKKGKGDFSMENDDNFIGKGEEDGRQTPPDQSEILESPEWGGSSLYEKAVVILARQQRERRI
jgi:hypothetical protein